MRKSLTIIFFLVSLVLISAVNAITWNKNPNLNNYDGVNIVITDTTRSYNYFDWQLAWYVWTDPNNWFREGRGDGVWYKDGILSLHSHFDSSDPSWWSGATAVAIAGQYAKDAAWGTYPGLEELPMNIFKNIVLEVRHKLDSLSCSDSFCQGIIDLWFEVKSSYGPDYLYGEDGIVTSRIESDRCRVDSFDIVYYYSDSGNLQEAEQQRRVGVVCSSQSPSVFWSGWMESPDVTATFYSPACPSGYPISCLTESDSGDTIVTITIDGNRCRVDSFDANGNWQRRRVGVVCSSQSPSVFWSGWVDRGDWIETFYSPKCTSGRPISCITESDIGQDIFIYGDDSIITMTIKEGRCKVVTYDAGYYGVGPGQRRRVGVVCSSQDSLTRWGRWERRDNEEINGIPLETFYSQSCDAGTYPVSCLSETSLNRTAKRIVGIDYYWATNNPICNFPNEGVDDEEILHVHLYDPYVCTLHNDWRFATLDVVEAIKRAQEVGNFHEFYFDWMDANLTMIHEVAEVVARGQNGYGDVTISIDSLRVKAECNSDSDCYDEYVCDPTYKKCIECYYSDIIPIEAGGYAPNYKCESVCGASLECDEKDVFTYLGIVGDVRRFCDKCKYYETCIEDVNINGKVDIADVGIAARAFGSFCDNDTCSPGYDCYGDYSGCNHLQKWNPEVDIDRDGRVNIYDVAMIAKAYGINCLEESVSLGLGRFNPLIVLVAIILVMIILGVFKLFLRS